MSHDFGGIKGKDGKCCVADEAPRTEAIYEEIL